MSLAQLIQRLPSGGDDPIRWARMRVGLVVLLVGAVFALGCSGKRQIREWQPDDHDQPEEEGQVEGQVPTQNPSQGSVEGSREGSDEGSGEGSGGDERAQADPAAQVEVLWRQQCMRCHGRDGSGRTSMAQRIPVADLRESELTEAEIVRVVTNGRREMPSFAEELDGDSIRALARKVLSLRP